MAVETEQFRASDLIGSAGVGGNAEKLINTLLDHYPPELQAAQLKRVNDELTADLDLTKVAKVVGVDYVDDAVVAGEDRRGSEAVVRYAYLDDRGAVWKGCFPYSDLKAGSSDEHVSQRDLSAESAAGREHQRILDAQAAAGPAADAGEPADPYAALADLNAQDLVKVMEDHPERVEAIKAFEVATRGDKARQTVIGFEAKPPDPGVVGAGDQAGSGTPPAS